jgi:hypothetical protein
VTVGSETTKVKQGASAHTHNADGRKSSSRRSKAQVWQFYCCAAQSCSVLLTNTTMQRGGAQC